MGIWGLEKLIESNSDSIIEHVKLSEIADLYRNEMKREPIMLVDASSCIFFMLNISSESKLLAADLKKAEENIEIFINKCYDIGIKLKIFFDGLKSGREELWIERNRRSLLELEMLYSKKSNLPKNRFEIGVFLQIAQKTFKSSDKCEITRSLHEADSDIIRFAKEKPTFAIFSRDTDLLMAEGAQYFLTAKNFDVDSMTTKNYNRKKLAEFLKIPPPKLIYFGAFCSCTGNNFNMMESFCIKNRIKNKWLGVAKYVKKNPVEDIPKGRYPLKKISWDMISFVKKQIDHFSGCDFVEDIHLTNDQHWNEILLLAKEQFKNLQMNKAILEILVNRKYLLNISHTNVFELLPVTAFRSFRKKIYGILFFECPDKNINVTEIGFENVQRGVLPQLKNTEVSFDLRPHPGLKVLWCPTEDKKPKVEFFCQVIHPELKPDYLKQIPEVFLLPFLTVFYLVWELEGIIKRSDMQTIFIHSVLVNRLTAEEILQYPKKIILDAFNLSKWFLESLGFFYILNSVCGDPFEKCQTKMYFDGKVFQDVWEKTNSSTNISGIFGREVYEEFKILEEKLFYIGNKCYGYEDPWNRK